MLRVHSARTENLTADVRAAIVQVCIAAHAEPDFQNLFDYVLSGALHFLAYRDTELVSHAMVTTRWLQYETQPLMKTAYVDAVATLPAYQGQGYGSAVMRLLASEMEDYTVACLETDKIGFYERLGWQVWRGALAGRSEQGLVPTPQQTGIMVLTLPQTPPLDFDAGLTIECQSERIW